MEEKNLLGIINQVDDGIFTIVAVDDEESTTVVKATVETEKVEFGNLYARFAKPKYDEPCDKIDILMKLEEDASVEDVKVPHIPVKNVAQWEIVEMKEILFYLIFHVFMSA